MADIVYIGEEAFVPIVYVSADMPVYSAHPYKDKEPGCHVNFALL
jgi:hypothetical protein